ncbi:MAG: tRNA pseudouridine(55) synthase TruB [Holosporaceae bacterium]|jgi:tRNA pseudouridine55 synthase|nr:tRNA pseudouridine(55) synthase TruB [Holosporaceae bacterium]
MFFHTENNFNGWLCLDKPAGISSNFAMLKVRKILRQKTGYVGTLDPFATGVLPIAVGEAKKFIRFIEDSDKKYVFTVSFGVATDSVDKDGRIVARTSKIPSKDDILKVIDEFHGEIEQIPPIFSAIKIRGKRACDRARNGESLRMPSRKVNIFSIKMMEENLEDGEATFKVSCSKGTYIRSLARDMAEKVGSLGYVKSLRRSKSGFFSLKDSISLEKLIKMGDTAQMADILIPLERPLDDIPALNLGDRDIGMLRNGLRLTIKKEEVFSSEVRIFDDVNQRFHGIGFVSSNGELKVVRMCIRNWGII